MISTTKKQKEPKKLKKLISTMEVAYLLGYPTVNAFLAKRKKLGINAICFNSRKLMFDEEALHDWIEAHREVRKKQPKDF